MRFVRFNEAQINPVFFMSDNDIKLVWKYSFFTPELPLSLTNDLRKINFIISSHLYSCLFWNGTLCYLFLTVLFDFFELLFRYSRNYSIFFILSIFIQNDNILFRLLKVCMISMVNLIQQFTTLDLKMKFFRIVMVFRSINNSRGYRVYLSHLNLSSFLIWLYK